MSNSTPNKLPARDRYQARVTELEQHIEESNRFAKKLVMARLGFALPGLALLAFGIIENTAPPWLWKLGVFLLVGFLAAATWHENNAWKIRQARLQLVGSKRLLARCRRDWASLLPLPTERVFQSYVTDLTHDLDVFGDRSLFRWLSLAATESGAKTLCSWLTTWEPFERIRDRQQAVQHIASEVDWRDRFHRAAVGYESTDSNPERIVQWCQSSSYFAGRQWLRIASWLGPACLVIGIGMFIAFNSEELNWLQVSGLVITGVGVAINFLLTVTVIAPIHDIFVAIGNANRELQFLRQMLESIESLVPQGKLLEDARKACESSGQRASVCVDRLQRIMSLAGLQKNPLFFIPYLILQMTFLWDVRVLERLEKWKLAFGSQSEKWLDSIGTLEAITSAAFIADEYPDWTYPKSPLGGSENALLLDVADLAHPLLNDAARVPNSVSVDARHALLLITGSNMAGKSTMLRSVGVNALLARLGSPVCASKWIGDSFELASSIRVQDSLQDGVSFFMAELKRLRRIVDQAEQERTPGGKQMLVLLDEILQGTNSRERQIAVERVLGQLVAFGSLVMTSTHDLELANNEAITSIAQIVHFREYFETVDGKEVMRFDYRMRHGVTPTTNALKLLEMVGLNKGIPSSRS